MSTRANVWKITHNTGMSLVGNMENRESKRVKIFEDS